MTKKCDKGKSCGSSCVERSKSCAVKFSAAQSRTLSKVATKVGVVALFEDVKGHGAPGHRAKFDQVRKQLHQELGHQIRKPEDIQEFQKRLEKEGLLPGAEKASAKVKESPETSREEWDSLSSRDYDSKLEKSKLERVGNPDYKGWSDSHSPDALIGGSGAAGKVVVNPDGTFVKRGIISEREASILDKVGRKDLGPNLLAADLNGKVKIEQKNGPDIELMSIEHLGLRHGRIAMTKVSGRDLDSLAQDPDAKIHGIPAADIYWKAMAQLHRLGIAHNDAHPGNLFVGDRSGKGRWIDFGISQESSKAALTEALGAFANEAVLHRKDYKKHMADDALGHIQPGNWQTREWPVSGMGRVDAVAIKPQAEKLKQDMPLLARIRRNRLQVDKLLKEKHGLSDDEIAAIYAHGIRSPLESYEQGPWKKITESDAQSLIDTLYKSVPEF